MYTKEISITGKHAFYVKELKDNYKLFSRYIDVYLVAPLIGYIHGKKEEKDTDSPHASDNARIHLEQINNERERLETNYRLIMLLDSEGKSSTEEQIDRAFRDDSKQENIENFNNNMKTFDQYFRGGVSILYESLLDNGTEKSDYLKNSYNLIKDFYREISGDIMQQVKEEFEGY